MSWGIHQRIYRSRVRKAAKNLPVHILQQRAYTALSRGRGRVGMLLTEAMLMRINIEQPSFHQTMYEIQRAMVQH